MHNIYKGLSRKERTLFEVDYSNMFLDLSPKVKEVKASKQMGPNST